MASGADLLMFLNASCAECGDLGPPPDSILRIPPPPLPAFLQRAPAPPPPPPPPGPGPGNGSAVPAALAAAAAGAANASSGLLGECSVQCDWGSGPGVQYVELPRQGPAVDDTWLLVLIAACAGVLLLGALLALLLLRCRVQRAGKPGLQLAAAAPLGKTGKLGAAGCEAVLYPCPSAGPDGRVLWAALTPRGTTHHFAADPGQAGAAAASAAASAGPPGPPGAPPGAVPCGPACPGAVRPPSPLPPPPPRCISFDNSGFVGTDEPGPGGGAAAAAGYAAESFPMSERASPAPRPRVSSPTRIEHPNLPPLNLMPGHPRTLRRGAPGPGSGPAGPAGLNGLNPNGLPPGHTPAVL